MVCISMVLIRRGIVELLVIFEELVGVDIVESDLGLISLTSLLRYSH